MQVDLPKVQLEFAELAAELENTDPVFATELMRIQDSLDEVGPGDEPSQLKTPLNKLQRFLKKAADKDSEVHRTLKTTKRGLELAQKIGKTYNKFAQWLGLPIVPDVFL